ncbi:FtsK/SpoIIIE domain-containing protein [Nonomuraea typhae]|uniref:FtsK/SpoIIIE domain-containing protein n=1 Tax=Nonomuraea typhae TaxID=2603600 RepID=A0ABW7YM89_9ACTN
MTEKARPDIYLVPRRSEDAPDLPLPAEQPPSTDLAVPDPAEVEPVVHTAVVDDPSIRIREAEERLLPRRALAVRPEQAAAAGRGLLNAAATVGRGWHSWAVRIWDGLTYGVYREQIRIHRATGNNEALGEWTDRRRQAGKDRRDFLKEFPRMMLGLAKVASVTLVVLVAGLPVLSLLVWITGAGEFTALFSWIGSVLRFVFTAVGLLWWPLVLSLPIVAVIAGWREGRRQATSPAWVVDGPAELTGRDVIPDESAILNALRELNLAALNKAFKAGWKPRIIQPTVRDANGYHTQLELPASVTVEMIIEKKKVLAHNLVRFPVEVWPTEPRNLPGVLDLWVADQGALSAPLDDWPLLHEGSADYFTSVPCCVDIRRRIINGRLFEANYAIAGMMGSGKSSLIITLLLGAMLDPLPDIDVFCMADNADYDPMRPRLRTLHTGTSADVVEHCLAVMNDLYNELSARGQALKDHGIRAATRQAAERDERLRPRILVIDECQALFLHDTLGQRALETAVKLQNAARKYAVTIIYATPEASTDSLPRRLMTITSNKACFAIGDQTSNDAVLGTGSYKAGISAVGLEPKTDESMGDVGTFMGRGFTPKPGLLRSHFVSQSQAGPVVQRALQIREKAGYGTASRTAPQARDLLDDLDEVLGSERVRVADIPPMLRRLAPHWLPYQTLTGLDLKDILNREHDIRVTNTGNVPRLDPADLRAHIARLKAGE